MTKDSRNKVERDIEEIKKQIWLLTLKVKNLRESTNKMKRDIRTNLHDESSVSDRKDKPETTERNMDELFREID